MEFRYYRHWRGRDATTEEIKRAYRKWRQIHPDVAGEECERSSRGGEAYAALTTPTNARL